MATYANSKGGNKGKKYNKRRGDEVATPESEARANEFMKWYGDNYDAIRGKLVYGELYDDQIATDTFLRIYDCIALDGLVVKDYKFYFLRSYHTNRLGALNKDSVAEARFLRDDATVNNIVVQDATYLDYEIAVETLRAEIVDYVRGQFDPYSVALFEIYMGLQPEISYRAMAEMLGIGVYEIWPLIGAIKKDIRYHFSDRRDYLLSIV